MSLVQRLVRFFNYVHATGPFHNPKFSEAIKKGHDEKIIQATYLSRISKNPQGKRIEYFGTKAKVGGETYIITPLKYLKKEN